MSNLIAESEGWFLKPIPAMFEGANLQFKRGDVIYTDENVRNLNWGEVSDWTGIQFVDSSWQASTIYLLKSVNRSVSISNKLIIDSASRETLIKTGVNWSAHEILNEQNSRFIVSLRKFREDGTVNGPQLNLTKAEFLRLQKTGSLEDGA